MTKVQDIYPADRVILREVGLRDGLQLVKKFPSTAGKQRWVREEYGAGVRHFEVGSFLPAKTFPQFVDVRDDHRDGGRSCRARMASRWCSTSAAATRRWHSGVGEIATVVSATEEHSQANANRSRDAAIANVKRLCDLRDASDHKPIVQCRDLDGAGLFDRGRRRSEGSDQTGGKMFRGRRRFRSPSPIPSATPARRQVGEFTKAAVKIAGAKPVCVHLHDTSGMGIANAAAALDAGARILDGSLGGLGGCPFAPGATGNVVFEDLVFLCESKGFATGIDIEKLVAVRGILRSEMPGEQLYGGMARAGLPDKKRAAA